MSNTSPWPKVPEGFELLPCLWQYFKREAVSWNVGCAGSISDAPSSLAKVARLRQLARWPKSGTLRDLLPNSVLFRQSTLRYRQENIGGRLAPIAETIVTKRFVEGKLHASF